MSFFSAQWAFRKKSSARYLVTVYVMDFACLPRSQGRLNASGISDAFVCLLMSQDESMSCDGPASAIKPPPKIPRFLECICFGM